MDLLTIGGFRTILGLKSFIPLLTPENKQKLSTSSYIVFRQSPSQPVKKPVKKT